MNQLKEKQVIWGMILIYIVFFGVFTAFRHYNFQTQTWDLAIFTQSLWNTLHGKIMYNNLEEVKNTLGVHFSPILFLLVPGYALFPTPYFLLFVQTLALGLGAWPLYLLAKKMLLDKKPWPLLITAGYLLYPSLHWVNTFDFHPVTFLVPLLIAAFYFIETKHWGWAYLFLTLAAATREDSILVVLFAGIFLFLRSLKQKNGREIKIGLAIIILSAFYFLLTTQIVMPALGGGLLRIDRYAHLGKTPLEIINNIPKTIFTVEKLGYVFWLLAPILFLPFFYWPSLLLIIPGLFENLLTNYGSQFSGFYQYDSVLIGSIFIAGLYGLKKALEKWPAKERIIRPLFITAMFIGYIIQSPVNPVLFPTEIFSAGGGSAFGGEPNPHWETFRKMVALVPNDPRISIAANTNLVPHLSNREHAYMLGREPFPVDWVLIDGADPFGFRDETSFQNYVDNYINSGNYTVQSLDNRYLILIKRP